MGNNRGTGLAALGSPDHPAPENSRSCPPALTRTTFLALARLSAIALTRSVVPPADAEFPEESEAAEIAIETQFQRLLTGLKWMPRNDRLHLARAARAWRRAALKALRERRAWERYGARRLRQAQRPMPMPS